MRSQFFPNLIVTHEIEPSMGSCPVLPKPGAPGMGLKSQANIFFVFMSQMNIDNTVQWREERLSALELVLEMNAASFTCWLRNYLPSMGVKFLIYTKVHSDLLR